MQDLVKKLSALLKKRKMVLATAESCTGGLLSSIITQESGASSIFERGFTTYSNEAKQEMLSVPKDTIAQHGAVSAETAEAMAQGALKNSRADIAVSITGIAGPDGGSDEKPVGLVFIGIALKHREPDTFEYRFEGDREEVQFGAVVAAIEHLIKALENE